MRWLRRLLTIPPDERERALARVEKDMFAADQVRAKARQLIAVAERTSETLRSDAEDADRRLTNGNHR